MNRIYEPHQSSIFDLDANILCCICYLLPLLTGILLPSLRLLSWLIPLLVFLFEKKSPFVKFHAAQCLVIQITVVLINIVLWFIAAMSAGTSLIFGMHIFSVIGTIGISSLLAGVISLGTLILQAIGAYKAYQWISYRLPIFGELTNIFVKE